MTFESRNATHESRSYLNKTILHDMIDSRETKTGITYLSRCGCSISVKRDLMYAPTVECKKCAKMKVDGEIKRKWGEPYERPVMEVRYAFSFTVTDEVQARRITDFLAREGIQGR